MSQAFLPFVHRSPSNFSGRSTQFHTFLEQRQMPLLQAADDRRRQIDSIEKLRAHNELMRKTFIENMGGIPKRNCPLDPQVTKVTDRGDYTVESVAFKSREGVYVTASLYLPKGLTEPAPAVLFFSGHTDSARMAPRYQEVCQTLVNAGLIVLATDPTGQGERKNFYDPETGQNPVPYAVPDHDCCGVPSLATGRFLTRYFIGDQLASVDYMLTRPEIDPRRIGITGCSGGGLQTMLSMITDDRIAAAAPATFTSTRREIQLSCQSQDSEQIWPGCAAYGFDHFEPFLIFAPKPILLLTVSSDFFPIEGAYEVYGEARRIYSLFGKEENVQIFEDDACHGYTQPLAEQAAVFFCRVFHTPKREGGAREAVPAEEMYVTGCGNVKGEYPDARTIPDETAIFAQELNAHRRSQEARGWLWEKVNHARIPCPARPRVDDAVNATMIDGYIGKSVMWWVQKNLSAFGVLICKGNDPLVQPRPTVIALWDHGTRAIADREDWIRAQCDAGKQVLVVDLPGVGAIEQAPVWGWSSYREAYGTMYKMCCDLLYMGDSMAAMQTYHVLRTADMLKEYRQIDEITLYCDGQEGVFGIMAGYLGGIGREYGEGLLTNVEEQILAQRPLHYDNTLCYLVPGMLAYFDYDELM